jgi:hypothetical protein
VKQQEGRISRLEKELKVATEEEICKQKTGNVSSNFMDQDNSGNLGGGGDSNTRSHRFSANYSQVQLNNKFRILAIDALEISQQTPVVLKHKGRELKSFTVKTERNKRKILLLGSSHGREIGPMLPENLGTKSDMGSIFKPNAPLAKALEDIYLYIYFIYFNCKWVFTWWQCTTITHK